jgi:16S rRNA A1518/A1519 N6-dimethyltransferase RsmA/KsgA/DIM1 with predicted DNA glycosylase/AP lyase activity
MIIFAYIVVFIIILFFVFVFVILFGAPYVPTMAEQRKNALDLLDLKKGQTVYELGSGDGSLLLEAAERGWRAVGYELNPILVLVSRWRARRYGNSVKIVWSNFWKADFSDADAIFVFQMDRSMKNLEAKIKKEVGDRPFKVASHAFKIPGKKPAKKSGAVLLYQY